MTEIPRIGRKKRRHVYMSRELDATADELLPGYVNFSEFAEQVLWQELLERYGEEAVLAAIEDAQADMSDEYRLPQEDRESIELPV